MWLVGFRWMWWRVGLVIFWVWVPFVCYCLSVLGHVEVTLGWQGCVITVGGSVCSCVSVG